MDLTPLKTGQYLKELLAQPFVPPAPLVDQFIYQGTTMMIAADPGTGKSTIALQIAASLSSGTKLFGKLDVVRPVPVYYLAMETLWEEFQQAREAMQEVCPIQEDNLWWDDEQVGLNILNPDHAARFFTRLKRWQAPKLIILDPLYMIVGGGLSKDEPASACVRFLRVLKQTFDCSLLILHHTHREKHDVEGKVVEERNPFYGSRWLEAFVHSAYHLKLRDEAHTGVILRNRKDRRKSCLPLLTLHYHPETMSCTLEEGQGETLLDRMMILLDQYRTDGRLTDAYQVQTVLKCSRQSVYNLLQYPEVKRRLELVKQAGQKTVWKVH